VIASAASAWLAIKMESLRPIRVQTIFNPPGMDALPRALDTSMEKLPGPSAAGNEHAFTVRFGDLDANRHVGNSKYVEWVMESAGRELLEGSMIECLGIDFLSETQYGGDVVVRTQRDPRVPARLEHVIVRTADGGESARARTEWRPR
jgi:medium-chain acyl-[acyl-carrier-protein] hydrolase